MTLPVVFSDEAKAEYHEAIEWYEQTAGSGMKFILRVRTVLTLIGQMPEIHRSVSSNLRRAVVKGTLYSLYYRIDPERVEIVAFFHNRRDPSEWLRRN